MHDLLQSPSGLRIPPLESTVQSPRTLSGATVASDVLLEPLSDVRSLSLLASLFEGVDDTFSKSFDVKDADEELCGTEEELGVDETIEKLCDAEKDSAVAESVESVASEVTAAVLAEEGDTSSVSP